MYELNCWLEDCELNSKYCDLIRRCTYATVHVHVPKCADKTRVIDASIPINNKHFLEN